MKKRLALFSHTGRTWEGSQGQARKEVSIAVSATGRVMSLYLPSMAVTQKHIKVLCQKRELVHREMESI
eukprot:867525-Pelagomonas_calceolata.AAC.2